MQDCLAAPLVHKAAGCHQGVLPATQLLGALVIPLHPPADHQAAMRGSVANPLDLQGRKGAGPGEGGCWTVRSPVLCTGLHAAVAGRSLPATLTCSECSEASSIPELDSACSCVVRTCC